MTKRWVFLNEEFKLEEFAVIPITDQGFLFGEGIFTTLRVHQGKCELFQGHLQQLQRYAEGLKFRLPLLKEEKMQELILRNKAKTGTWRLKIIVTVKDEGEKRRVGNVLATLHPYQGESIKPYTLCLFPYPLESPLAHIKSLAYLDHLYVRQYARQQGYEDAITRTHAGLLLETGCSNIFWIDQDMCWVPDPQLPYLKGVFLQALLAHLTLPIHFVKTTMGEIPDSASVYTCNALTHVRPVVVIQQRAFLRNPLWEDLLEKATQQALETHLTHKERYFD